MDDNNFRDDRAKKILIKLATDFIKTESNNQSMITITNLSASNDFSKVTYFISVFPSQKEAAAVDFLKRQRSDFRDYVKSNSRLARIPRFDFEIDLGEKARQRIEEIL
jgi:ribosome-binding factor A